MSEVIVENVYKIYAGDRGREVLAVEDATLKIKSEEFMVFVGPSGCGKSTTLRMIAGLEEISRGNIYIDGKRINDVQPKDRDIAMVFQNYALYPHMSVYRNMAFGLQLRRRPKAEIDQRVREAAQILGLSDEMLERRPKALSGGQRQRVALGRAIVRKPKVFLFDEPLSNLDAKMRVQMRAEIAKLHNRLSTTMIYVTHDQIEAMTMGDRICLMQHGRIQQVAEPLEIYNQPANLFVAAFIGNPAMNFFEGTIAARSDRLEFAEANPTAGATPLVVTVDPQHESRLRKFIGQKLVLGLRPEDLEEAEKPAAGSPSTFRAKLEIVEPLGSETHLYLTTGAHEFIARSPVSLQHRIGDSVLLTANMAKAHFFELADRSAFRKETGETDTERWQAACPAIV